MAGQQIWAHCAESRLPFVGSVSFGVDTTTAWVRSAYTPTMADAFRRAGRWTTMDPQPGYIAFWDFPGRSWVGSSSLPSP